MYRESGCPTHRARALRPLALIRDSAGDILAAMKFRGSQSDACAHATTSLTSTRRFARGPSRLVGLVPVLFLSIAEFNLLECDDCDGVALGDISGNGKMDLLMS
jgi:hypothetical protein